MTRRGRPVGSVKLTPDMADRIVAFIEGGAADYVAAEAVGIDARTFRDWTARGEGRHPERAPTPALVALARRVREAKARARAAREIIVAEKEPKFWLTHMARSRPGREGWTEPVGGPGEDDPAREPDPYQPSPEELHEIVRVLSEAGVLPPMCEDPECSCVHRRRKDA